MEKEKKVYSVSQLKKYMKCPYAYKLAYIDKLEIERTFIGTLIGSAFHKCIELNINPNDFDKINEILQEIYKEKVNAGIKIELPPKGKPHKHLTDKEWELYLLTDAVSTISDFIKVTPKIEFLEHEKEINFKIGKYDFVGIVDFIADGFFGDFKTTYSYNYFNPEEYKLQIALYSYALKIQNASLFVYSRNDEIKLKIFNYKFDDKKIQEYLELAEKICFAIEHEIFWKKEAKWVWNWMYKRMALTDQWCDRVCGFRNYCFGEPPLKDDCEN